MRLLAFVLLGLFAFAFLAGAAEIDDVSRDALQPGRSALQFEIDDGFFVSGFEGTTLSYKRMISERSAWRFGVTYGGSTFDGEEFRQDVVDTSLVPDSDAETSSSAFGSRTLRSSVASSTTCFCWICVWYKIMSFPISCAPFSMCAPEESFIASRTVGRLRCAAAESSGHGPWARVQVVATGK